MSVEHIGKGYVKIYVSEEELENSIAGLSQLKPILQTQVMKGNGRNTKQGLIDAAELGKHFDTAIACRHGGQLKAVPDTTGSIRQIFTDYGVL